MPALVLKFSGVPPIAIWLLASPRQTRWAKAVQLACLVPGETMKQRPVSSL